MAIKLSFVQREYAIQAKYLAALEGVRTGHQGHDTMLMPAFRKANLLPGYEHAIEDFFSWTGDDPSRPVNIDWHTRANHGASSQVCCVNFLFPMASSAELVSRWIEHVTGLRGVFALPIERRCGQDWFITFEWFPEEDYLNEANKKGHRPRGSNSTSVDAAVCFAHDGRRHLMLIEWKYTESYSATREKNAEKGDGTRDGRYGHLWKRPHGPIRADAGVELSDFYLNPWYQLLRQQMLAYHCEADPLSGYDRVSVLHIAPSGNTALKRAQGVLAAKTGSADLISGFAALLHPELRDRFQSVDTEWAFSPVAAWPEAEAWWSLLAARYPSLCATGDRT